MIAVPAGVRVMKATRLPKATRLQGRYQASRLPTWCRWLGRAGPRDAWAGSFRRNNFCFPLEASRPGEDCGLGRLRSGSILEASGARCIPVAADQRWRDAANVSATGCIDRRYGLVASGSTRCETTDRNVVRDCDLLNQAANNVSQRTTNLIQIPACRSTLSQPILVLCGLW